jgi:Protein of unknown function (DUF3800)
MAELVYVDETGSPGTKGSSKQPRITLAAVIVDESSVQSLTEELRKVAWKHLGWIPADLEFHGVQIWHGQDHWEKKDPPELLAAYKDAIDILDTLNLSVAYSSIHKQRLHNRYGGAADKNAYRLALQFLVEKLDALPGNKIIIADEKKEEELRATKMLADMQHYGGGEVPGRTLKHVIDTLHFVDSAASPGVQMADMVAFILQRYWRGKETHPDAQSGLSAMYGMVMEHTSTWRDVWPVS